MTSPSTYDDAPSIRCPKCGLVSFNASDIRFGYCGACHWWTSDPILKQIDPLAVMEQLTRPGDRG